MEMTETTMSLQGWQIYQDPLTGRWYLYVVDAAGKPNIRLIP
jgi:hypothetical protein